MPSPFPGMDPYLESPEFWPGVHHLLISTILEILNPALLPRYACRVEERVYVAPDPYPSLARVRLPDAHVAPVLGTGGGTAPSGEAFAVTSEGASWFEVEETTEPLREAYLVIRTRDGSDVVTVIEVLSPANKNPAAATRAEYLEKRREVLESQAHLVEIDLLRGGRRPVRVFGPEGDVYAVYVNLAPVRRKTRVLMWPVSRPIPAVPIPLRADDPPVQLDLQRAVALTYARGAYHALIKYHKPPIPPLGPDAAAWAERLLAALDKPPGGLEGPLQ
ncbi:DUF4058 family protein [Limnochorda pilosa]|uniref:DUF4058 domain-containing protein n=1 Tax=Limnochorda pilosa TaxID=1555112 RepID=A0A0K2SNT5_LIMPI|nr:DUF4058 family protein [Limnochorda pilosa]BAS28494.1 hypothetical protein LIP_2664 [Limnochorda pilosa]